MTQRWIRLSIGLLVALLATGCANFETTRAFASQGDKVATSVNTEFDFLSAQCAQSDAVFALLLGNTDPAAPPNQMTSACKGMDAALAQLSAHTLDLFGKYNDAIAAISDGSKYDLSASFGNTAAKLEALKTKSGPVIDGESVDVVLKTANLLADIATSAIRSREMKRLLDAGGEDWPKVMSPLKTFFGPHPGNTGVQPSPYQITVTALNGSNDAMVAFLGRKTDRVRCIPVSGRAIECEPIRATEMIYEANLRKLGFADRISPDPSRPSKTARAVQDAIDAWLQAHESLRQEAFRPDAKQLWDRLQVLRARAEDLQAAIAAHRKG